MRALSKADVEAMGFERLTAEIDVILRDPVFAAWPADRQLPMIERVSAIYTGYWHASGHTLIPALEGLDRQIVGAGVVRHSHDPAGKLLGRKDVRVWRHDNRPVGDDGAPTDLSRADLIVLRAAVVTPLAGVVQRGTANLAGGAVAQ